MTAKLSTRKGAGWAVVLAFVFFALSALAVLLLGARSYRALVARDEDAFSRRSAVQYIAAKVRHGDMLHAVTVEEFSPQHPIPTLLLRETIEGEPYLTRIYCYDGALRELFTWAGEEVAPQDGQAVLEAAGLALSLEDNLLTCAVTDPTGQVSTLTLSLRTGGEVTAP